MNAQGGGAAEVPQLIAFVSKQTGLSQAQVLAALKANFPHTLALLQMLPLSAVNGEIPGLFAFLEKALKVTPTELVAALKTNFPAITQAIVYLTPVVNAGMTCRAQLTSPTTAAPRSGRCPQSERTSRAS